MMETSTTLCESLLSRGCLSRRLSKSLKLMSFLLLFLAVGCQFQDDRTLIGDYHLTYMNACEVRIYRKAALDPQMLDGSIQSYAVRLPFITGYADTRCIDADSERKAPGYFLIDTRTHIIQQTMTEEEWRNELKKIGWDHPDLNTVRRTRG
ncbi:MAG: hypothetical protein DMG31_00405 [Acidobacteria bacterium]|nr:MAG: hypothetical protein DMG31_00405 [Acidobacteriota bacterium]